MFILHLFFSFFEFSHISTASLTKTWFLSNICSATLLLSKLLFSVELLCFMHLAYIACSGRHIYHHNSNRVFRWVRLLTRMVVYSLNSRFWHKVLLFLVTVLILYIFFSKLLSMDLIILGKRLTTFGGPLLEISVVRSLMRICCVCFIRKSLSNYALYPFN